MGWFLAALSGTLAAFSHITRFGDWHWPHLNFLAFFCWVPLFIAIAQSGARRAFALSFVAAIFHYGISQYWLYNAIHNFGGLSRGTSIGVMLLLFIILGVYFALIFLLSQWLHHKTQWPLLWLRPMSWVAIEYLRNHIPFGGYPWSHIGYTQTNFLSFIQSADLFGVYIVTFLLVLCNEVIFLFYQERKDLKNKKLWRACLPVFILIAANLAYGFFTLQYYTDKTPYRSLKVGVVQGNIPQEEKWERLNYRKILNIYQEGAQQLEEQGAELIIWPEASLPVSAFYDTPRFPTLLGAKTAPVLLGAITRSKDFKGPPQLRPVHNSALLVNPQQKVLAYYHKSRLVPFGEYVPLKKFFFFARQLTVAVGNMQPGQIAQPMDYQDIPLGILICYEDVFPDIARRTVANGAKVLINMSNDAWYGYSSAAFQHQAFSQFRAVETRRSLVRATNTGVSSLIRPTGEIEWQGGLFTREIKLTDLPFYQDKSIYIKIGDLLPQIFLISLAILGMIAFLKKNGKIKHEQRASR